MARNERRFGTEIEESRCHFPDCWSLKATLPKDAPCSPPHAVRPPAKATPSSCANCSRTPSSTSAIRPTAAPTCPTGWVWRATTASPSPAPRCNIYNGGPEIERQIELVRTGLDSGTPMFGSCWGLQVLTTAAGGVVRKNPQRPRNRLRPPHRADRSRPRPRHVRPQGRRSSMHSPCISTRSRRWRPNMQVLAANAVSQVQAAEIRYNGTTAWGVQYHPEYSLHDMAATIRRYGKRHGGRRLLLARERADPVRRRDGDAALRPQEQGAVLEARDRPAACSTRACGCARSTTGSSTRCCRRAASAAGADAGFPTAGSRCCGSCRGDGAAQTIRQTSSNSKRGSRGPGSPGSPMAEAAQESSIG